MSLFMPALLGIWCVVVGILQSTEAATREFGLIEISQFAVWFLSAAIACMLAARPGPAPTRLVLLWLGVVALICGARELDVHLWIAPHNFGEWGMRFKLNWWTDLSVPLAPKILWGAIGLCILAALTLPLAFARLNPIRRLRLGMPDTWLFAIAVVFLGLGGVFDDLLREALSDEPRKLAEETTESLGAGFFFSSVLTAYRISRPGKQVSQADADTSDT